mmetsp:Transcript_44902/g.90712  ORF Transcript_44902/g.90712 Transcript_44902/m.90712 type:complete len:230 (+) Transcript_44902:108-797(+)
MSSTFSWSACRSSAAVAWARALVCRSLKASTSSKWSSTSRSPVSSSARLPLAWRFFAAGIFFDRSASGRDRGLVRSIRSTMASSIDGSRHLVSQSTTKAPSMPSGAEVFAGSPSLTDAAAGVDAVGEATVAASRLRKATIPARPSSSSHSATMRSRNLTSTSETSPATAAAPPGVSALDAATLNALPATATVAPAAPSTLAASTFGDKNASAARRELWSWRRRSGDDAN